MLGSGVVGEQPEARADGVGGEVPVAATGWSDTATARRSTRLSGHRADRRAQIIRAAAEAVERHGPEASTARIAALAGVARPHVYRHFSSKDDLTEELARYAAAELRAAVRPTLSTSGTPLQVIAGAVGAAVDWATEHPRLYHFVTARSARPSRTHFLQEIVDATLAYAAAQGLAVPRPEGVLAGLMGMVDASIVWWLDQHDEPRDVLVSRLSRQVWAVMELVLHDLGATLDATTTITTGG